MEPFQNGYIIIHKQNPLYDFTRTFHHVSDASSANVDLASESVTFQLRHGALVANALGGGHRGTLITKVVPFPVSDSKRIVPPCLSTTTEWLIANP